MGAESSRCTGCMPLPFGQSQDGFNKMQLGEMTDLHAENIDPWTTEHLEQGLDLSCCGNPPVEPLVLANSPDGDLVQMDPVKGDMWLEEAALTVSLERRPRTEAVRIDDTTGRVQINTQPPRSAKKQDGATRAWPAGVIKEVKPQATAGST
mmetsp:Transcript_34717/g.81053  ORF Transcript_34717/g.81053 Transcript_34717/m.81053 type:complete len:151 (+) Transcript_34717:89-541(+)